MTSPRPRFLVALGLVLALLAVAVPRAQQTGKKEHAFRGKIEKVDQKAKTLTVNGENVEGWMGAMTMTYKVANDAVLKAVKAGDQISATVYDGDFSTLHDVKMLPPAGKK